jgi:heptosyltransferase III
VNILILHPGALGDVILSLPALFLLRGRFPDAIISLAGDSDKIAVAEHGYADKLIPLSSLPLHRLYSADTMSEVDLAFWNSFDRIVSWTGHGNPEIVQKFGKLRAQVLCARWKPESGDNRHVSQIFVDSLHAWLFNQTALPETKILLGGKNRENAAEWLAAKGWKGEKLIAVHPGAGGMVKRWGLDGFRNLARQICSADYSILILEGPAECGLGKDLQAGLPSGYTYLAETVSLPLLSGLLTCSSAFAGNDSGVAHLAAGLGVPTVVVFGPTDPQQWAPRGSHVSVLRRNAECSACNGGKGKKHTCLQNISAAELWRELLKYLQIPSNPSAFLH